MLATLPIQGCFSAADDREFTVKKGEMISALDLEVAPDGSLLLLAQIGMYYAREGEPEKYQRSNLHTVLYRRTSGAWSATPFKNLQTSENFFPSFLRDRDGAFRILVWDAGLAKAYGLQGDRWLPHATVRRPRSFGGNLWIADKNWNRNPQYGYKDDTTLYQVYWEDDGTAKLREGRSRQDEHTLGFGYTPLAFHSGTGYFALVGMDRDTAAGEWASRPSYRYWQKDMKEMETATLDGLDFRDTTLVGRGPGYRDQGMAWPSETFFAPYRNGTGLYYCLDTRCGILALDSSGAPASLEPPKTPPGRMTVELGSKLAPDTGGCIHGLEHYVERDTNGFVQPYEPPSKAGIVMVWDGCRGVKDTVSLWESPDGTPFLLLSRRFRLLPDGSPVLAALVQENPPYTARSRPESPLARTWILFAEKRQGVWSTRIIDNR